MSIKSPTHHSLVGPKKNTLLCPFSSVLLQRNSRLSLVLGMAAKNESKGLWQTLKPFVNGGLSGIGATAVIQPIDIVKVKASGEAALAVSLRRLRPGCLCACACIAQRLSTLAPSLAAPRGLRAGVSLWAPATDFFRPRSACRSPAAARPSRWPPRS
jgi:hypothetical protein